MQWLKNLFWSSTVVRAPVSTHLLPSNTVFEHTPQHVLDDGKAAYAALKHRQDNNCWREAFATLDSQCKDFQLQDKQRLALALTHCHLKDASRASTGCGKAKDIYGCLGNIKDDSTFNSYTAFFISVDSICHYLQAEDWHAQTEVLIQDLGNTAKTSLRVHEQVLQESGIVMDQTLHINTVLTEMVKQADTTKSIIDDLQQQLQEHAVASEAAHAETRVKAEELLFTVDSLYDFASTVSNGWRRASSASYMLVSLNLAWLATTLPCFQGARGWLFLMVTLETGIEVLMGDRLTSIRELRIFSLFLAICVLLLRKLRQKRNDCGEQPVKTLMSRKQLVVLAKKHGIAANKKSVDIERELKRLSW